MLSAQQTTKRPAPSGVRSTATVGPSFLPRRRRSPAPKESQGSEETGSARDEAAGPLGGQGAPATVGAPYPGSTIRLRRHAQVRTHRIPALGELGLQDF